MPAQMFVQRIQRIGIRSLEKWVHFRRAHHVYQHEVFAANQGNVSDKTVRKNGIGKVRKKEQECSFSQFQPELCEQVVKIRADDVRLQRINGVPAGSVMSFAACCAKK